MKTLVGSIFLFLVLIPLPATPQITCFSYIGGMVSCDGPNNSNTTIMPFPANPNMGIITQHGNGQDTWEPYTIFHGTPSPSRSQAQLPLLLAPTQSEPSRSRASRSERRSIEPLDSLDRLPSLSGDLGDPFEEIDSFMRLGE